MNHQELGWEPFLAEIGSHPTPTGGRHAASERFADYLETTGLPAHAEMIRLHNQQNDGSKPMGSHPGGYLYPEDSGYQDAPLQPWSHPLSFVDTHGPYISPDRGTPYKSVYMYLPRHGGLLGHIVYSVKMTPLQADTLYGALGQEGAETPEPKRPRRELREVIRDVNGQVVSSSRNLAGIRNHERRLRRQGVGVRRIGISRYGDGSGHLMVLFDNGHNYETTFMDYGLMQNWLRNWRSVHGAPLTADGQDAGEVSYRNPHLGGRA